MSEPLASAMRVLITIPHYFQAGGRRNSDGRPHGSVGIRPQSRVQALSASINALHAQFGKRQVMLEPSRLVARPVNQSSVATIDIVVCTTRGCHVLHMLSLPPGRFVHYQTKCEPVLLGFECHAVLRDRIGAYDLYCYLEDDLIVHDPTFFVKLGWFTKQTSNQNLLLPNRFEVGANPLSDKVYLDGDLPKTATRRFQDVGRRGTLETKVLGVPVRFRRALNPHAGCFFLSAQQMEHWMRQDYFLDRDVRFVGPLESAASLGIMRTFRVYKPATENASFLEIQHFGTAFLDLVRHRG